MSRLTTVSIENSIKVCVVCVFVCICIKRVYSIYLSVGSRWFSTITLRIKQSCKTLARALLVVEPFAKSWCVFINPTILSLTLVAYLCVQQFGPERAANWTCFRSLAKLFERQDGCFGRSSGSSSAHQI